jgi:hypothetical protein
MWFIRLSHTCAPPLHSPGTDAGVIVVNKTHTVLDLLKCMARPVRETLLSHRKMSGYNWWLLWRSAQGRKAPLLSPRWVSRADRHGHESKKSQGDESTWTGRWYDTWLERQGDVGLMAVHCSQGSGHQEQWEATTGFCFPFLPFF